MEKEAVYMGDLLDEFKSFVMDMIAEGHDKDYDDHMQFLSHCLEVFIDLKEDQA